jgi:hypothetical protein
LSSTEYLIGRNCGITFAGIKPASMISVKTEESGLAEKITENFSHRGFFLVRLKCYEKRCINLIYNENALKKVLFSKENREFLHEYGYEYVSVKEAIDKLKERMKEDDFPHEIGIFLGYPLCDVKGFIHSPHEGIKLCGYWKVYSDEAVTAKKFDRFRKCSECICRRMEQGESLAKIFKTGQTGNIPQGYRRLT